MKNTINKIVAIEEKLASSYVSLDAKVAELQANGGAGTSAAVQQAKTMATTASTTATAAQTTATAAQTTANQAKNAATQAAGQAQQAYTKAENLETSLEYLTNLEFHNTTQKNAAIKALDDMLSALSN